MRPTGVLSRARLIALLLAVSVVVSFGTAVIVVWWKEPPRWRHPLPEHTSVLDSRARAVIAAWERHPPVTQRRYRAVRPSAPESIGGWTFVSGGDGDDAERAIGGNRLRATVALDAARPADAVVRWDDGAVAEQPLVSQKEALAAVNAESCRRPPCDSDVVRHVVGVELGTVPLRTAHGWATVPAWLFALAHTSARIARVALVPERVPHLLGESFHQPGISYQRISHGVLLPGTPTDASRHLSVDFLGAPPDGGPCGGRYTAHAVEGESSVVVVVEPMRRQHEEQVICDHFLTPFGPFQQVTVTLSRPLGERVLLDLSDGLPRTVSRPPLT